MGTKDSGKCSFCGENICAKVIERNFLRRDKCRCPKCEEIIYVCRSPFCSNYTKGGILYDDELCTSCFSSLKGSAAETFEKVKSFTQEVEAQKESFRQLSDDDIFLKWKSRKSDKVIVFAANAVLKERGLSKDDIALRLNK